MSETEYFVIKREKCDRCTNGTITLVHKSDVSVEPIIIECSYCTKGYIETRENLLDVLAKLRWYNGEYTDRFKNLKIEEAE